MNGYGRWLKAGSQAGSRPASVNGAPRQHLSRHDNLTLNNELWIITRGERHTIGSSAATSVLSFDVSSGKDAVIAVVGEPSKAEVIERPSKVTKKLIDASMEIYTKEYGAGYEHLFESDLRGIRFSNLRYERSLARVRRLIRTEIYDASWYARWLKFTLRGRFVKVRYKL